MQGAAILLAGGAHPPPGRKIKHASDARPMLTSSESDTPCSAMLCIIEARLLLRLLAQLGGPEPCSCCAVGRNTEDRLAVKDALRCRPSRPLLTPPPDASPPAGVLAPDMLTLSSSAEERRSAWASLAATLLMMEPIAMDTLRWGSFCGWEGGGAHVSICTLCEGAV